MTLPRLPTTVAVIVRMEPALYEALKDVAKENERSMAATIRFLITQHVKGKP